MWCKYNAQVCICASVRKRERERERDDILRILSIHINFFKTSPHTDTLYSVNTCTCTKNFRKNFLSKYGIKYNVCMCALISSYWSFVFEFIMKSTHRNYFLWFNCRYLIGMNHLRYLFSETFLTFCLSLKGLWIVIDWNWNLKTEN